MISNGEEGDREKDIYSDETKNKRNKKDRMKGIERNRKFPEKISA